MQNSHSPSHIKDCYHTHSVEETQALGKRIAALFSEGGIGFLYGEPGAGKTHLVKGLSRGLGHEGLVTSPTYAIVNLYEGRMTIRHVDLYRLQEEDLEEAGIFSLLEEPGILLVEWPHCLESYVKDAIRIRMEKTGDTTRRITIERGE